jgi:hypothetical protein
MCSVPPYFTVPPDGCHFTLYRDGRRVVVHAKHKDPAAAFVAFRALAGQNCTVLVVRLNNEAACHLTILRASGIDPDALEHDLAFHADVIRACIRD